MSIILRDADMRQLTGDPTPELRGQASASLALEGSWDDPNTRRGGGDVTVVGHRATFGGFQPTEVHWGRAALRFDDCQRRDGADAG